MESHPVPQQISSYQFRLVGDMTLKQFFQVGGGALISLLIYATGIHPLLKWPLIIISFSLGAAMAFLPFEERPLNKWIVSFFRSVYSPTIFFWKRSPAYLFYQEEEIPQQPTISTLPAEKAIDNYLKSLPDQKFSFLSRLEEGEQTFLHKLSSLFTISPTVKKPKEEEPEQNLPVQTPKNVSVPTPGPTTVAQTGFRPKIVVEETPVKQDIFQTGAQQVSVSPLFAKKEEVKTKEVEFSLEASPPSPPTIPNTIVGQVISDQGKIVDGAILEIKDSAGRPVRALRSNKVGHFIIVTSLPNGKYSVTTEKDNFEFEPLSFEAKGEIIPPIVVRAMPLQNQEARIGNQELPNDKQETPNQNQEASVTN